MSQEEKIAIAQRGVNAFAKAETSLRDFTDAMNDLITVYHDGAAADMASGGFVLKETAKFQQFIGAAGHLLEGVIHAHERGTAKAKENDADVALPEGYVTTMGGGR
jgi:hypothetical protein